MRGTLHESGRSSFVPVLNRANSVKAKYIPPRATHTPTSVRWSFLLFAFTLPLQTADLVFMNGSLSPAKISGLLFFACYLSYYNPLSKKGSFPPVPRPMWWFAGYIAVYALNGLFVPDELFEEFCTGLNTLVQLIVLFWFASNLLNDEKIVKSFCLAFSIAAVIVALGTILQVPGFSSTVADRTTALGNDPNNVANLMAVAAVIILGLSLNTVSKDIISRILLISLILPLLIALVQTASRGGTLAFMAGCLVYSGPFLNSKRKWLAIVLGLLLAGFVVYLAVSSPIFVERMQETYRDSSLAGREKLIPAAIQMILERPIFGWHPVEFMYVLSPRAGFTSFSDSHNLILWVLLEGGLIAGVPFFVGAWLCGRAAWKARSGYFGPLPLALFLTLFTANMSITGIYNKDLWLTFALSVAAEASLARRLRQRRAILSTHRPTRMRHETHGYS
jgi:O-antigen ligase